VRNKVKVLLTVFFNYCGIVHHSYAPEGQTIDKEYYLEVIRHLCDAVRRKRPDLWASRNWQLHHDNAPAHSSHLIQSFLAEHGIPVVRQVPYSPDMAPCDFWLFPKLKRPLKGSRFDSREDIMRNATKELRSLPEEAFRKFFQQWKERWAKVSSRKGPILKGIRNWAPQVCNFSSWPKVGYFLDRVVNTAGNTIQTYNLLEKRQHNTSGEK
jgi:transposase